MFNTNRQAGTENSGNEKEFNPDVEITQEMIEAGVEALRNSGLCGEGISILDHELVLQILTAALAPLDKLL